MLVQGRRLCEKCWLSFSLHCLRFGWICTCAWSSGSEQSSVLWSRLTSLLLLHVIDSDRQMVDTITCKVLWLEGLPFSREFPRMISQMVLCHKPPGASGYHVTQSQRLHGGLIIKGTGRKVRKKPCDGRRTHPWGASYVRKKIVIMQWYECFLLQSIMRFEKNQNKIIGRTKWAKAKNRSSEPIIEREIRFLR